MYSVSDGFEGKEANPIGKLMRGKQSTRPRAQAVKFGPRFGVLELVEARVETDTESIVKHQRIKTARKGHNTSAAAANTGMEHVGSPR